LALPKRPGTIAGEPTAAPSLTPVASSNVSPEVSSRCHKAMVFPSTTCGAWARHRGEAASERQEARTAARPVWARAAVLMLFSLEEIIGGRRAAAHATRHESPAGPSLS